MKSLRLQVDQDRVRQLGVSSKSLAEPLNAVTSGMVITEVRDSIYLTDLVARVLSALAPAGGYQSSWGTLLLVLGG
jgi:multidrug efflux pump subunit AcrB